jgi:hypothetical protein
MFDQRSLYNNDNLPMIILFCQDVQDDMDGQKNGEINNFPLGIPNANESVLDLKLLQKGFEIEELTDKNPGQKDEDNTTEQKKVFGVIKKTKNLFIKIQQKGSFIIKKSMEFFSKHRKKLAVLGLVLVGTTVIAIAIAIEKKIIFLPLAKVKFK